MGSTLISNPKPQRSLFGMLSHLAHVWSCRANTRSSSYGSAVSNSVWFSWSQVDAKFTSWLQKCPPLVGMTTSHIHKSKNVKQQGATDPYKWGNHQALDHTNTHTHDLRREAVLQVVISNRAVTFFSKDAIMTQIGVTILPRSEGIFLQFAEMEIKRLFFSSESVIFNEQTAFGEMLNRFFSWLKLIAVFIKCNTCIFCTIYKHVSAIDPKSPLYRREILNLQACIDVVNESAPLLINYKYLLARYSLFPTATLSLATTLYQRNNQHSPDAI